MSFGLIDAVEYSPMAANMDLRPGVFPAFVIYNVRNHDAFPFDQRKEITAAAIDEFVANVAQGKVKSGPISHDDLETDEYVEQDAEKGELEAEMKPVEKHDEL
jgi:hypothetical protein